MRTAASERLKRAVELVLFKEPPIRAILRDSTVLLPSLGFLLVVNLIQKLGAVVSPVVEGAVTYQLSWHSMLSETFWTTLFMLGVFLMLGFLARSLSHGKLTISGVLQLLAYASLVQIVGFFPPLVFVGHLWLLALLFSFGYRIKSLL